MILSFVISTRVEKYLWSPPKSLRRLAGICPASPPSCIATSSTYQPLGTSVHPGHWKMEDRWWLGWGSIYSISSPRVAWGTRAGPVEVAQDWALSLALPKGDNLTLWKGVGLNNRPNKSNKSNKRGPRAGFNTCFEVYKLFIGSKKLVVSSLCRLLLWRDNKLPSNHLTYKVYEVDEIMGVRRRSTITQSGRVLYKLGGVGVSVNHPRYSTRSLKNLY